jgi:uncharacterized GH25 family protein
LKKTHSAFQLFLVLPGLFTSTLSAHDFWLEAHPFYTQPGNTVELSVHVGTEFVGDSLPNIPNWYTDFSIYQRASKTPVEGVLGNDPAGAFKPQQQGTYAIGYQSDFTYIEIDSATFKKYLHEEGLDNAIAYRQKHNLTQQTAKEDYVRHVKTLVQSGSAFDIDHSMIKFGYDLEIMPLQNPYKKSIHDPLDVQVLYNNRPEHDILVIAFSKLKPDLMQRVRTDNKGVASISIDQPGPWLIKAVKIIRLQNQKADWQSHWASLTFEMLNAE